MAKKIIGGIGSLLGIKKKKAETPAVPPATEHKARFTPVVTPLGEADPRRRLVRSNMTSGPTILSDKLGG